MRNEKQEEIFYNADCVLKEMSVNIVKYFKEFTNLSNSNEKSYRSIEYETGISRNTLSNIMNQKGVPLIGTLVKLALYYKLDLNDLFTKKLIDNADVNNNDTNNDDNAGNNDKLPQKLSRKEQLEIMVGGCGYTEDEKNAILSVIKLINKNYKTS